MERITEAGPNVNNVEHVNSKYNVLVLSFCSWCGFRPHHAFRNRVSASLLLWLESFKRLFRITSSARSLGGSATPIVMSVEILMDGRLTKMEKVLGVKLDKLDQTMTRDTYSCKMSQTSGGFITPDHVKLIDCVLETLPLTKVLGVVYDTLCDDILVWIFPMYAIGTSANSRHTMALQLWEVASRGTPHWAGASVNGNCDRAIGKVPSPQNGLYPLISSVMQLYLDTADKDVNVFINKLALYEGAEYKTIVFSRLCLFILTNYKLKQDCAQDKVDSRYISRLFRLIIDNLTNTGGGFMLPTLLDDGTYDTDANFASPDKELTTWLMDVKRARLLAIITSWGDNSIPHQALDASSLYRSWAKLLVNPAVRLHYQPQCSPILPSPTKQTLKFIPLWTGVEKKHSLTISIRVGASRTHLKVLNDLFPHTSKTDKKHQTCHLADIVWAIIMAKNFTTPPKVPIVYNVGAGDRVSERLDRPARIRMLNKIFQYIPVGTNNIMACVAVVNAMGHRSATAFIDNVLKPKLLFAPLFEVTQRLKLVSALARRGQCGVVAQEVAPLAVSVLAYLELAIGRSHNITDWEEEKANRCNDTIHIQAPSPLLIDQTTNQVRWSEDKELLNSRLRVRSSEFHSRLHAKLLDICAPLVTKRATRETFRDFLRRRSEWMASGSGGGAQLDVAEIYPDDPHYKKLAQQGKSKVKLSKRGWAENMPIDKLHQALYHRHPREESHASEKFENGKARAIYGVDPFHYVINTYATKGFEEKLHTLRGLEKGASGLVLSQQEHMRARITEDPNIQCDMLDYADFNRHHTPEVQAMLFNTFAELGEKVGACKDWVAANKWVADSKSNMRVRFPNSPNVYKVNQGMFSGTRSTDLMNTLLNLAYFEVAKDWVKEYYGIVPIDLYHVHQGDDVWLSNKNILWSRMVYYTLNQMGFIFQLNKQMFGKGRGEYLRVLYQNGSALGYVNRSMINFILRPLQNDQTSDPVAWAHTITEGCSTLARRGLTPTMCQVLWDNNINYWCKAKAAPMDRAGVRIALDAIRLSALNGGLGCPRPFELSISQDRLVLPKLANLDIPLSAFPANMTDDWIDYVSEARQPIDGTFNINAPAVRQASLSNSYANMPWHISRTNTWAQYKAAWRKWNDDHKNGDTCSRSRVTHHKIATASDVGAAISHTFRTPCDYTTRFEAIEKNMLAVGTDPNFYEAKSLFRGNTMLNKMAASSRFKSISLTATAYGISSKQAIQCVLAEAAESETASSEARKVIQAILSSNSELALALLLTPGELPLSAMACMADQNLLNFCTTQLGDCFAQFMSRTSHVSFEGQLKLLGVPMQSMANSIQKRCELFSRAMY